MNVLTLTQDRSLTELDWSVVEIARNDGPRSIRPPGRFTKFLSGFFGIPVPKQLANEDLEALRRFCVRAWYWDFIRTRDLRMLVEAGYSSSAVFQILAYIAGFRGFTPSLQENPV